MPIEKAFAIKASPRVIYEAIERDLGDANSDDTWGVVRREPPNAIDLRVTIGGIPCDLAYRLTRKSDHTEVEAILNPYGWKHQLFRSITFGMHNHGFEAALVQSLANLKEAVEGDAGGFPDEGSLIVTPADE